MKNFLITSAFILAAFSFKAQSIWVYAAEKVKGVEIPVQWEEFEVTINDSIKRKFTAQNDGSLGRFSLDNGKYKVTIKSLNFVYADVTRDDVIIKDFRTTDVVFTLMKLTPAQIEEKKKAAGK